MVSQKVQTGILYVLGLPIGNKQDISERAIETIKKCDVFACEDTRSFQELIKSLDHLNLSLKNKKLISYYDHNEREKSDELILLLKEQNNVCLVSDAGTPQVSDPGYHILKKCFEEKIPVVGVPGCSSVTLAISVCPIGGQSFYFAGFAPEKDFERELFLKELLKKSDRNIVFEAPHRILEHLEQVKNLCSHKIFLARELTKKHEELLYDTPENLFNHFKNNKPLGEFVLIYPKVENKLTLEEIKSEISSYIDSNIKPNDILKRIQTSTDLPRRQIYDLITEIKHLLKKDK